MSKNQHGLSIHKGKTHTNKTEIKMHKVNFNENISQKHESITKGDSKSNGTQNANIMKPSVKKQKCDQCDYESLYQRFLQDHIKRKHGDKTEPPKLNSQNITIVVCNICEKWFDSERELRHHKVNNHITDKDAIIGTKRDESFLVKSNSFFPKRKRRLVEEHIPNSSPPPTNPPVLLPEPHTNTPESPIKTDKEENNFQDDIKIKSVEKQNMDPKVTELPELVKQIVHDGSKEVNITGNGSCLIGTTAVHIAGDEELTPHIARNLNTHLALNREYYLDKIKSDFPFTAIIGTSGNTKTFNKGEEDMFFDWLAESKEAIYMWRGCVDIIGLCNICQMDIDCIVYMEGTAPEVRHFSPNPDFPWKDDDTMKPKILNRREH